MEQIMPDGGCAAMAPGWLDFPFAPLTAQFVGRSAAFLLSKPTYFAGP
jgi:hypothetical protein